MDESPRQLHPSMGSKKTITTDIEGPLSEAATKLIGAISASITIATLLGVGWSIFAWVH
jgi:hypothetical protein